MFFSLPFHAAKFVEVEDLAVFADTRLDVDDFVGVAGEKIGDFNDNSERNQKDTADEADENIKQTFYKTVYGVSHTFTLV